MTVTGGGYLAGPVAVDATIDLERRRNCVPRQPLSVAIGHALDVRLAATSPDSMGRHLVCQLVDETVVEAAR